MDILKKPENMYHSVSPEKSPAIHFWINKKSGIDKVNFPKAHFTIHHSGEAIIQSPNVHNMEKAIEQVQL